MMRQKQRKTIEEVYGSKSDASKSQVTSIYQNNGSRTGRATDRYYGHTPHNNMLPEAAQKSLNAGKETTRHRSARALNNIVEEKTFSKETFSMVDGRRSPALTTKTEKISYISPYSKYKENAAKENLQHHQHHHRHSHDNHHNSHDEDKDDDTDEFFELIRCTVESAIGKSISELLNRNFRELSAKVDNFSADLKNTNALLNQVQNELNNKIIHYGEENSRHFRYLCMKSEYDKMFYQHHTLVATAKPSNMETVPETKTSKRRKSSPKPNRSLPKLQRKDGNKATITPACPCRDKKCKQPASETKEPPNTSSRETSQKSSEVNIRDVLAHIQKFCTQIKSTDFKSNQSAEATEIKQLKNEITPEDLVKLNEAFTEDDVDDEDDDWEISSDGMTPRNNSNNLHTYASNTTKGCITQRGNSGAGDG